MNDENKKTENENNEQLIRQAAKYYAQYNGQKGTDKQVDKLVKQLRHLVINMAEMRGFKAAQS